MKRSLLIAGLLMSVSPAYATCEDYTDGSTTNPAPKVPFVTRDNMMKQPLMLYVEVPEPGIMRNTVTALLL